MEQRSDTDCNEFLTSVSLSFYPSLFLCTSQGTKNSCSTKQKWRNAVICSDYIQLPVPMNKSPNFSLLQVVKKQHYLYMSDNEMEDHGTYDKL